MTKTCNRCNKTKDISLFALHNQIKSGYSTKCRSCESERGKERYKRISDKAKAQAAFYRVNNHERRLEIERASRERNKEKNRLRKNERQRTRNKIYKEDKYFILDKELRRIYTSPCFMCGSTENQSLDHVIPLSRGGKHSIGNVITLCLTCNLSKNNKTFTEWKKSRNLIGVD